MKTSHWYSLGIAAVAALFFMPFLGGVRLFDWDEINFAEISREMLVLGDYLRVHVNFEPFWEKPPFFFWMQSLSMHLFGVGEYAARFPNALCGLITLVLLFQVGRKLYDQQFGLLWALAYLGSTLPHLYFKSGIIDPYFNLFIFGGLYGFVLFYWKKEGYEGIALKRNYWFYLLLGGLVLGMGVLTKGPVAFLIVCLVFFVYWVMKRFRLYVSIPQFLAFTLATSLVTLAWYGLETLQHGPWFIEEFTRYQYRLFSTPDAGHKGFPGYHFVVVLIGCFPVSILALRGFFRMPQAHLYQENFRTWMLILFWVVMILFSIVQSKIVHYSSMSYFPLTYLGALVMYRVVRRELALPAWLKGGLAVVGGIYVLLTLVAPFVGMNIELLKPLLSKDPFAVANLAADVRWTGWEVIPGLLLLGVLGMSFWWLRRQRFERGFYTLFLGNAVFVTLGLIFFIARIEGYSQAAAMRFYESLQGKDCYVVPAGFKSYGQLFYFRKSPDAHPDSYDKQWLLHGDIDKDVYVVTKIHRTDLLDGVEGLVQIGAENGFVFFKRSKEAPRSEDGAE